jgi:hypothetical protein
MVAGWATSVGAGASGLLLKDATAERLFDAVRVVEWRPG